MRKELAQLVALPKHQATEAEWEALYHNQAFLKAVVAIKEQQVRFQSEPPRSKEQIIANAYIAEGIRIALKAIEIAETGAGQLGKKADNGE